mmetsp:Transcript_43050/g.108190  ORF Transcript_43050/g.108190 Transcript_43050/m.108190 type:complete len:233 (-) Transcript_43050:578-1276(-)
MPVGAAPSAALVHQFFVAAPLLALAVIHLLAASGVVRRSVREDGGDGPCDLVPVDRARSVLVQRLPGLRRRPEIQVLLMQFLHRRSPRGASAAQPGRRRGLPRGSPSLAEFLPGCRPTRQLKEHHRAPYGAQLLHVVPLADSGTFEEKGGLWRVLGISSLSPDCELDMCRAVLPRTVPQDEAPLRPQSPVALHGYRRLRERFAQDALDVHDCVRRQGLDLCDGCEVERQPRN